MIYVKLIELGSEIKEWTLENDSTVGDLFDAAEKDFVEGAVTRNQTVVSEDDYLRDGDRIFSGKAVKGNLEPFMVAFARLSDSTVELPAEDGYTIKRTLEQLSDEMRPSFYNADNTSAYEYRVGGRPVDENHVLTRPASGAARVICSKRTKGNLG